VEFQSLISSLAQAVSCRLSSYFPPEAISSLESEFTEVRFQRIIADIRNNWIVHIGASNTSEKHDELVSVFLIHLIGPLNRMKLPEGVERHKFIYVFMRLLSQLLEHDLVRKQFDALSAQLMLAA
jgi:hypothetical protein